jgi:hypothetical protein
LIGGTIASGTYFLTSDQVFGADGGTGNTGNTVQETVVISGNTAQVVMNSNGRCQRQTFTLSTTSNNLTATGTCGSTPSSDGGVASVMGRYEVTMTTFSVALPNGGAGTEILTFTKQP